VTCASASECWAVGNGNNGSGYGYPVIERWDGSSWSPGASTTKGSGFQPNLANATCPTKSMCLAVGTSAGSTASHDTTLAEQWNGSSWGLVPSANGSTSDDNFLDGVSCASASECWAVGLSQAPNLSTPDEALLQSWNGSAFEPASFPVPGSSVYADELYDTTCYDGTCWAVGGYAPAPNQARLTFILEHPAGS
jgi:hypothetical protein